MVLDSAAVEYIATRVEELLEREKQSFTPPPPPISPLIRTPPQTRISPLLETTSQSKSPPKSHKKTLPSRVARVPPASHPAPPPAAPTTPPHRHPSKSPPKSHKKTSPSRVARVPPASHPAPPPAAPTTPPHRHPTPQRTYTRPRPITDFVQHMELPPSTPYVDPQTARYIREIEQLKQVNRQAEQNAQRFHHDYMEVSRNAELYRQQCNYYQGSVVSGGHNNYNYGKRGR